MLLPLPEVVERIRAQGGVVYAPHPFAYPREPRRRAERALAVADAVEAINARAFWPGWNRMATRVARERGLPLVAGSDAHFVSEIGRARSEMPAFASVDEFRAGLSQARPFQLVVSSPGLHVASMGIKYGRRLNQGWSELLSSRPLRRRVARAS